MSASEMEFQTLTNEYKTIEGAIGAAMAAAEVERHSDAAMGAANLAEFLLTENKALKQALLPFSRWFEQLQRAMPGLPDDTLVGGMPHAPILIGHLRKAHIELVLSGKDTPENG